MSGGGGGELRVLRQDREEQPPPESSRMPAWKREILERRRAKGGGQEVSPSGGGGGGGVGGPQRLNNGSGLVVNGSRQQQQADVGSVGSGRNYTITTAMQHFGANKESRLTERPAGRDGGAEEESLVLQESLGPLEENPFMKLEKERRRRQDRENAARPVQHILELYGSVPGIRTIRAENIIIIESDPEYFPDGAGAAGSKWQQNGVSAYSSLNDLLDRRGSAVTEIRAKEVVIYDTTISKSEENLSTLGRPDPELQAFDGLGGEGQGRVSQMLQKFDSNYGKLQKKSHSTENLLDLDCSSASHRPRLWTPKPDAVPKPGLEPVTPVLQSPGTFKPKAEPESPQRTPNHSVYSFRQRFEDGSPARDETDSRPTPKPTREREWDSGSDPKPKVPCSPETRRARASEATPSSKMIRSSPNFEIRPSPKPDLAGIPENDTQARALANLRLQSKNSITVIPKRRPAASPAPAGPVKSSPSHRAVPTSPTATANDFSKSSPLKTTTLKTTTSDTVRTAHSETSTVIPKRPSSPTKRPSSPTKAPSSPTKRPSSPTKRPSSPTKAPSSPTKTPSSPTKAPSSPTKTPSSPTKPVAKPVIVPSTSPEASSPKQDDPTQPESPSRVPASPPAFASPPSSPRVPLSPPHSPSSAVPPPADLLPVTNIDDMVEESRGPVPSPQVHRRTGKTITVVPKRRAETDSPQQPELQSDVPAAVGAGEAPPGSTPPAQAPYSQLGTLLKKRYPAVEEIEVIGGYLALAKSCLVKTGSTGKKLKISFNEASLQSTYEYPSESTWDSEDEEDEGRRESPAEQPSMVGRIHIPRPTLGGSPTHPNNANDLSNYIPKHAVDFNTWQEQRNQESAHREDSPQPTILTEEVMLTPADSSSLSDFSSEPALYF